MMIPQDRIFALLIFVFIIQPSFAADWPQWRGPERDGVSAETGWLAEWKAEGPARLWQAQVGKGCASFAVAAGKLYTMGNQADTDTVFCLDALSGKLIWRHDYPCALDPNQFEGGPGATPTVFEGMVYTLSREGHVFALDAASGNAIWSRRSEKDWGAKKSQNYAIWGFNSSPLVEGELVIVNAGALAALNRKSGAIVWKTENLHGDSGSPIALELPGIGRCVAAMVPYGLVLVKAQDGTEVLRHPLKNRFNVNVNTPVVSGTRILITTGAKAGSVLLDVADGKPAVIWENKYLSGKFTSPVLLDGNLYGTDETILKCLDWNTGAERWQHDGVGLGALIAAGRKLIILTEKGQALVAAATPEKYSEISNFQALGRRNWVLPVLAGGLLYLRNNEGELVCLDLRTNPAN